MFHLSMACNHCEEPTCVEACLMRCLDFGDLDELSKKYGEDWEKRKSCKKSIVGMYFSAARKYDKDIKKEGVMNHADV